MITTELHLAIEALKNDEVVAIPTETVYGLAAKATSATAVKKIFKLKQRPLSHPLIMHVGASWDLTPWVRLIPPYAKQLMQHFWPGPLTLVFFSQETVDPLITGGQNTIAIRSPAHPLAQALLNELGCPLVAPSANLFGKLSPTLACHVEASFGEKDLLILDGGRCEQGIESTILLATDPKTYQILRAGSISLPQIQTVLPQVPIQPDLTIRAPGRLLHHYQPEKPLYAFQDATALLHFCQQTTHTPYVLAFTPLTPSPNLYFQLPSFPKATAFELYYRLHEADASIATCIAIELPPKTADWEAVRERIEKAAAKIY